jgi:hypothetical protein
MTVAVHQLVVLANGDVRIPPSGTGQVAHGHRTPDGIVKIVVPASKNWVLVQLEIEVDHGNAPSSLANVLADRDGNQTPLAGRNVGSS